MNSWGRYDLGGDGGTSSLTLDASGNFSVEITPPGGSVETDTGTITVVGDMLKIYSAGDMRTTAAHYVLVDANTLQITSNDESDDFDGDETDESAVMYLALIKQ
ncbi:MAG: hypothetical protein R6W82_02170 [bacterium]